jgi:GDP/UDP-N,N'-diacetylbacillosamine 2-epimerase (hydrolysing)
MESRNKKRKIGVFTGTRADYGLLKSLMNKIKENINCELITIVSGMHLEAKFGYSYKQIKKDGFNIDSKINLKLSDSNKESNVRGIGLGIINISKSLLKLKPDFLVVLGDRSEALAATISAAYLNIPIAHISGGDSAQAGLDEPARHSISKFSSLHFPATKKSGERLQKMGEDKWRINVVGEPGLEILTNTILPTKKKLEKELNVKIEESFMLIVQHPVSTEVEETEKNTKKILKAINRFKKQKIIIYPNSDAGGQKIIKLLKEQKKRKDTIIFKNLSRENYVFLLTNCDILIGNSSSGIVESSSFKKPTINIGNRQKGRERTINVIDANNDEEEIYKSIKKGLSKKFKEKMKMVKNPYYKPNTSQKILDILLKTKINNKLIQKKLTY